MHLFVELNKNFVTADMIGLREAW